MTVYIRSGKPRPMSYCCGVLEIGDFRHSDSKFTPDKYGDYLTTEGNDLRACAKEHIKKFIDEHNGYLLILNFYRQNPEKGYEDTYNDVVEDDLEPAFQSHELMDAFKEAGAKEIATFINPNSLNEVCTLVYTAGLFSLEKK